MTVISLPFSSVRARRTRAGLVPGRAGGRLHPAIRFFLKNHSRFTFGMVIAATRAAP
jgi:hypothetical protein